MIKIQSRGYSFFVVTLVYIAAAVGGIFLFRALSDLPLFLALLIADGAATAFVFLFSLLFGNSSVYDPYWSVQPAVILVALAFSLHEALSAVGILLLIAVCLWAVRLTANWAYTFKGLMHEDWRYRMLAEKTGKAYPLINFLGIHLFPTLVVYACVLPAAYAFTEVGKPNLLSLLGFLLSVLAVALQLVSDIEMQAYRRLRTGNFIRTGLWRYARHPNYLGEILMWWGVGILSVSVMPGRWYFLLGALINTLMFLFISIPMADRRQSQKEGYSEYRAATHSLVPLPKRKH